MRSFVLGFAASVLCLAFAITGCAGALGAIVPTETPTTTAATTTSTLASDNPTSTAPASVLASVTSSVIPTAVPSATSPPLPFLSPTTLKYRLLAQFGDVFFCDPDFYPVAHEVDDQQVDQRVAELAKNTEEYQTILQHLGLVGATTLTPDEKRLVYAESKKLNAISLETSGDGYQFSLRISEGAGARNGFAITGTIDRSGTITLTKRQSTFLTCPICLAADTLIDTPLGLVPVQDVKRGMLIWTADTSGARQRGVVVAVIRRPTPQDFQIVHIVLGDGREILASPNHPTVDGRTVGTLSVGDFLDGAKVVKAERVPYQGSETFDVLPSGETGAYWANGILLRSTLR